MNHRWFWRPLTAAALLLSLASCTPSLQQYRHKTPRLDLQQYFNGRVEAWGLVQDGRGNVTRRFQVSIDGRWQGDTGTLDEHFRFDDGEKQFRRWTLTKLDDQRYRGIAADVVGEAAGEVAGNTLRWRYTLRLPVDGSTYDIAFDDWMYQMDEQHLFNKATLSKFGIEVGEVTLFFQKVAAPAS
ncbi:MAG: DUF3833 domain-containing protein [Pseudomonadota bacterium]